MFHLLSHEQGAGGESILVDGYRAFQILKEEEGEEALQSLVGLSVRSHASGNADVQMRARAPVMSMHNKIPTNGAHIVPYLRWPALRWNNDDRAAMIGSRSQAIADWYDSARKFDRILKRESSEHRVQLQPGGPISKPKPLII